MTGSAVPLAREQAPEQKAGRAGVLTAIALFKFVKAVSLASVGTLGVVFGRDWQALYEVDDAGNRVRVQALSHAIHRVVAAITHLDEKDFEWLRAGMFAYAAVFLVEGIGLWLSKRWAEWLTVVVTASFVPIELYEIFRMPTALRVVSLLVNLGIVVYLVLRRLRERHSH